MDFTNCFDPTLGQDIQTELHECCVTEEIFHESEMIFDHEENRWFHKSKVVEYNEQLAIEFGWSEQELQDNLNFLKSL